MSDDALVFGPDDVDLSRSPLRRSLAEPTHVLGAFNPGLTRLPDGDLLLMVRVAEALDRPVRDGAVRSVRWTRDGYALDAWPLDAVDMADPRQFKLRQPGPPLLGLTSLSWLLPVRLSPDGRAVKAVHYEHAVAPSSDTQAYGVEDARISRIDGAYWMTVCSVGPERLGTSLYRSTDGLYWEPLGLVLDHLNKDMLLFEGRPGGRYMALTRPLGEVYFAHPPGGEGLGGPAIHFAASPDLLHWRPLETPGLRARAGSRVRKVGGGTPPVLTPSGWLTLYHGVEPQGPVGAYRSYWALLDRDDPTRILRQEDDAPLLEADAALTAPIAHQQYLASPVVFSTGMVEDGDDWLVASGEADLACRLTRIHKARFT